MITDNPTRPTEPSLRGATRPNPGNPIGQLTRVYREAGLPIEAARRCALADFRCNFPQVLGGV